VAQAVVGNNEGIEARSCGRHYHGRRTGAGQRELGVRPKVRRRERPGRRHRRVGLHRIRIGTHINSWPGVRIGIGPGPTRKARIQKRRARGVAACQRQNEQGKNAAHERLIASAICAAKGNFKVVGTLRVP
jgi:hypothetical protein